LLLADVSDISLALGSGAARGLAHIGVIQVLQEQGVHVRAVAGCSIGAAIGGFFAAGCLEQAEAVYRKMTLNDVIRNFDPVFPSAGLIDGRKMVRTIRRLVGDRLVSETDIPFYPVATHLDSGEMHILENVPLWEAIRASISIPGLFKPYQLCGKWYVDGGLTNPLPVDVLKSRHPDLPVLAVNLNLPPSDYQRNWNPEPEDEEERFLDRLPRVRDFLESRGIDWKRRNSAPGMLHILNRTFHIFQYEIAWRSLELNRPEGSITPLLPDMLFYDFHRAEEAILEGRRVTEAFLNGPCTESRRR